MFNVNWEMVFGWGIPSFVLRSLRSSNRLPEELAALVGVPQDAAFHPEGDAFEHTCHVTDAMLDIVSREGITGNWRMVYMFAALTHDLGKATTTVWNSEKGKYTSYGHEVASVPLAARFLERAGVAPKIVEYVLPLVRHHMAHTRPAFTVKAVRKLALALQPATIADLCLLMEADCAGRPPIPPGLPAAVTDQLLPTAAVNGWLTAPPKERVLML